MSTVTEENGIKKEVQTGKVSVDKVYKADYQKAGTSTAQLRQVVTTVAHYPTKQVVTDLQDNIFSMSDFGFETQSYENKETRVAWIDVPEGTTAEQVLAKLEGNPNATLYRMLSNRPILTSSQKYAISNPELEVSLDDFANRQAVRYPEGSENAGALALDNNGKIQYRAIFFSSQGNKDVDSRTAEPSDYYASQALLQEISQDATIVDDQEL